MEVKITNGKVILREVLTRKAQKEFNKILFAGASANKEGEISLNMERTEEANDALVLNMVEKIIIGDKDVQVNIEILDNLPQEDYQSILNEIEKLRSKKK